MLPYQCFLPGYLYPLNHPQHCFFPAIYEREIIPSISAQWFNCLEFLLPEHKRLNERSYLGRQPDSADLRSQNCLRYLSHPHSPGEPFTFRHPLVADHACNQDCNSPVNYLYTNLDPNPDVFCARDWPYPINTGGIFPRRG